jgi:hypothetical protein
MVKSCCGWAAAAARRALGRRLARRGPGIAAHGLRLGVALEGGAEGTSLRRHHLVRRQARPIHGRVAAIATAKVRRLRRVPSPTSVSFAAAAPNPNRAARQDPRARRWGPTRCRRAPVRACTSSWSSAPACSLCPPSSTAPPPWEVPCPWTCARRPASSSTALSLSPPPPPPPPPPPRRSPRTPSGRTRPPRPRQWPPACLRPCRSRRPSPPPPPPPARRRRSRSSRTTASRRTLRPAWRWRRPRSLRPTTMGTSSGSTPRRGCCRRKRNCSTTSPARAPSRRWRRARPPSSCPRPTSSTTLP